MDSVFFVSRQQELVSTSVVDFYGSLNLTVSGVKQFHRALKKHCVGKPKSCEKIREMQIVNYKCKHKELFRAMKSYGQVHSVPLSLEKKMRKEWRPT